MRRKVESLGVPIAIATPGGGHEAIGVGAPLLTITVRSERGMQALRSLSELRIVDAYLDGDIDFEGDLIGAMDLRRVMSDWQLPLRVANVAGRLLLGRRRSNPRWIAKHYDTQNMQLFALDELYHVYTPGVYATDADTLEQGAERKLQLAYDALGLRTGDSLLDIGCGWGGFLRFCARRGVDATGISLSRHQLEFARQRLDDEGLRADTRYQDFFDYEPGRRFDAISLMGSIEDLSSYGEVLRRLRAWLAPGGRVYLDFAGRDRPWGIASFVTKHVWPGAFRMVYLPAFTRAMARTHFDVVEMHNDRGNYHRWARLGLERWTQRRDAVLAAADDRTWRLMHVLTAGTAYVMGPRSTWATAYRVVLESRAAPQPRPPAVRHEAMAQPVGGVAQPAGGVAQPAGGV